MTTVDPEDLKHRLTVFDAARAAVDRHLVLLRQHVYAPPGAPAAEGTPFADVLRAYLELRTKEDAAAADFEALLHDS